MNEAHSHSEGHGQDKNTDRDKRADDPVSLGEVIEELVDSGSVTGEPDAERAARTKVRRLEDEVTSLQTERGLVFRGNLEAGENVNDLEAVNNATHGAEADLAQAEERLEALVDEAEQRHPSSGPHTE